MSKQKNNLPQHWFLFPRTVCGYVGRVSPVAPVARKDTDKYDLDLSSQQNVQTSNNKVTTYHSDDF